MLHKSLPLLLLAPVLVVLPPGCGGGGSPIDSGFGDGRMLVTVGPGGGTVEGRGGTPLGGFALEIPAGALRELVRLEIRVGTDIELPGTLPATVAVAIRATPDPGVLAIPARLRMPCSFPATRDPADLLVAGVRTASNGEVRPGLAAEFGTFDRGLSTFDADLGVLADLQVRYTTDPRLVEDAGALFGLALDSLDRLTDESLVRADGQLAAALQADPFYPPARLLRAVTRILVVANDRTTTGPGLSSIGEALTRAGLDLRSRSLLRRLVDGDWPVHATPGSDPPTPGDVLEMLQALLRPALEAGLEDLAFVPPQDRIVLRLPGSIARLSGDREVDATDVCFLRAACSFVLYALDALEDVVLTVDVKYLVSPAAENDSLADLLARFPDFGRSRARPAQRTVDSLVAAVDALAQAFALLNRETDPQADDVIVFSSSFDAHKRDRWQGDIEGLLKSVRGGGAHELLALERRVVPVDLIALARGLDFRALAPAIAEFEPLAGSLPDPSFGGLLPGVTQDTATRLLRLPNAFALPQVQVAIDGRVSDWPKEAEALSPPDATGDGGALPNLDLERVFLGVDGDDLVCRFSLASGSFGWQSGRTVVFGFDLRPQREQPRQGGPTLQVVVEIAEAGPEVTVRRDGEVVEVEHAVAVSGGELELALDRFDIFHPDEPVRARVFRAFSHGLESGSGKTGGDRTRRILFRF